MKLFFVVVYANLCVFLGMVSTLHSSFRTLKEQSILHPTWLSWRFCVNSLLNSSVRIKRLCKSKQQWWYLCAYVCTRVCVVFVLLPSFRLSQPLVPGEVHDWVHDGAKGGRVVAADRLQKLFVNRRWWGPHVCDNRQHNKPSQHCTQQEGPTAAT